MMKVFNKKENLGITLIALVITIIVLIILAGVAINLSLGDNGIFNKAKYATESYLNEQEREEIEIAKATNEIFGYVSSREGNSLSMTSPKLLFSANLPATGAETRKAGTYKVSSDWYTKENENICNNYLEFVKDAGWKVKKSGWYYIKGYAQFYANTSTSVDGYINLYLNNNVFDAIGNRAHNGNLERIFLSSTVYLEKNDIIDSDFVTSAVSTWNNASFDIYTMTN